MVIQDDTYAILLVIISIVDQLVPHPWVLLVLVYGLSGTSDSTSLFLIYLLSANLRFCHRRRLGRTP